MPCCFKIAKFTFLNQYEGYRSLLKTNEMAYSDFTLAKVIKTFELTLSDRVNMFSDVAEVESSDFLTETLNEYLPLALASNTEKSRSELIIAPILVELRKQLKYQVSWFSGIDFTVDPEIINIDLGEYYISDINKILGILASGINSEF